MGKFMVKTKFGTWRVESWLPIAHGFLQHVAYSARLDESPWAVMLF